MKPNHNFCKKAWVKKLYFFFPLVSCALGLTATANAQTILVTDSSKRVLADTLLTSKITAPVNNYTDNIKQSINQLSPKKQANELKAKVKQQVSQVNDKLKNSFGTLKKQPVALNLSLENSLQYQPAPIAPLLSESVYHPKFLDVVAVNGAMELFGVPLNINVSSNRREFLGQGGFNSNLFKFDFDPKQFNNLFLSDVQRFYELRKNVFGGSDLTGYTQKMITDQVQLTGQSLQKSAGDSILSKYLSNPDHINQLLSMDHTQIQQKLLSNLQENIPVSKTTLNTNSLSLIKIKGQSSYLSNLMSNPDVARYLGDPVNLSKLKGLPETQIAQQLTSVSKKQEQSVSLNIEPEYDFLTGLNVSRIVNNSLKQKNETQQIVIHDLAHQLATNKNNNISINQLVQQQEQSYRQQVTGIENSNQQAIILAKTTGISLSQNPDLIGKTDSIALIVTQVKQQLADKGYDVTQLLQIQKFTSSAGRFGGISEEEQSFLSKKPANAFQAAVAKFSALKIGSFGNQVPGSTQNQDLFMNGAHATFKLGYTPITIGYGSQNDIKSIKDADFQSTVYSTPRNLTYLGANLKGGWGGGLKISIIGSVNKQYSYTNYQLPSLSSNNIALTLSKTYRMGKLGDAVVDVSKTTTLYSNKYNAGAEAILDRKAGLYNASTDLFQSFSFGVNHHLDIQQLGMSDNVYFSYAGMGYQNPGNNGYGGAQLKFGGAVKKAFYKNKLIVNLRSDVRNQPISYTSNDQWKNFQIQLDSRYSINKKFNIALKYTNNITDKQIDNVTTPVYSFQKIQFDGNSTYKIGKNYSVSHLSIGKQDLSNSYAGSSTANMIMVMYTQSLLIKQKSLTVNAFYNKELSANKLIGDMFNSDLSYQFPITKKISLSTGITYLDNTGIARQAGIRESIQLVSVAHFDIGSFIDLRKNLITPQYADLYAATRAELTIKYHLNY